jgi:hypothetical protein
MWIVKRICPIYIEAKETGTVKWAGEKLIKVNFLKLFDAAKGYPV